MKNLPDKRIITSDEIYDMDSGYRKNLINSLGGFKSLNLLGTCDDRGNNNLSLLSSVVHIGADPPLMGFIQRPITVERHSYQNIKELGFFTFNHVHPEILAQAHQSSARYPKEVSEFDATGLTPLFVPSFPSPFVKESQVRIGLEFCEEYKIKANDTILIIGAVKQIHVPSHVVSEQGHIDLDRTESLTVANLDTYYFAQKLIRLSYAKPDRPLRDITE